MKKLKAFLIDSKNRTISEYENTGLESLQKAVGGYIESAHGLSNGDVIFVNEEGLLVGDQEHWFFFFGAHQPFVGNGVVVGAYDDDGEEADAASTLSSLNRVVRFYTRSEILQMSEGA